MRNEKCGTTRHSHHPSINFAAHYHQWSNDTPATEPNRGRPSVRLGSPRSPVPRNKEKCPVIRLYYHGGTCSITLSNFMVIGDARLDRLQRLLKFLKG